MYVYICLYLPSYIFLFYSLIYWKLIYANLDLNISITLGELILGHPVLLGWTRMKVSDLGEQRGRNIYLQPCCRERRPLLNKRKSCSLWTDQWQVLNFSLGQWPHTRASSFVKRRKSRHSGHPLYSNNISENNRRRPGIKVICLDRFNSKHII